MDAIAGVFFEIELAKLFMQILEGWPDLACASEYPNLLMRRANLRTTMDPIRRHPMGAKHETQRKIAEQIALARA